MLDQQTEKSVIDDIQRACLDDILTIKEVCQMYSKTHKTIITLVKEGKLIGRQARFGSIWLVSKMSCDERWPDYGRS